MQLPSALRISLALSLPFSLFSISPPPPSLSLVHSPRLQALPGYPHNPHGENSISLEALLFQRTNSSATAIKF